MVKKKNYIERGYANITLLLFSPLQRSIPDFPFCLRESKTGKKRAFPVVER